MNNKGSNNQTTFKIEELAKVMDKMRPLFDVVRLVDPLQTMVLTIDEDLKIKRERKPCYKFWNRESRCDNCSSMLAAGTCSVMTKYERIGKETFNVLSRPIMVEDGEETIQVVIEIVSRVKYNDVSSLKRILIVDDQKVNRTQLTMLLKEDYQCCEAENGVEALRILEELEGKVQAVILDLHMPELDGFGTMAAMAADSRFAGIPILVATSEEDVNQEKRCLENGAWDFVQKPYQASLLKIRLKNIIGRSRANYMEQFKVLSERDTLTGIYNREKFFEKTRELLNGNVETSFALIRIDIDRFALFNSYFGDSQGDKLINYMAALIKETLSNVERVTYGRIESDVFCICVPFDQENIERYVRTIGKRLKEYLPNYYIEPSFGMYTIADPKESIATMYSHATMAANSRKNNSLKAFAIYDESMSSRLEKEQEIANDMQAALDEGQFKVYIQPKYDLQLNVPYGGEALARWEHPTKGLVMPGEFIQVFEKNGFIAKLDYYMWESVCKYLRKWMDEGIEPGPISVNVSRISMCNPHIISELKSLIGKYNIPVELLNLEITESAYMDSPDMMRNLVEQLRSLGFIVMMDDFGSGYSSLNTLKDIMVDVLKVDMKFLQSSDNQKRSERILSSILRMASWLNLPVIVEGVETEAQKNFLQSFGCRYGQGFLWAKPMPASEYEAVIKAKNYKSEIKYEPADQNLIDLIWSNDKKITYILSALGVPICIYGCCNTRMEIIRSNKSFNQAFGCQCHISEYKVLLENFEMAIDSKGCFPFDKEMTSMDGKKKLYRIKANYFGVIGSMKLVLAIFYEID